MKSLVTVSGVAFLFHQSGGLTSILMAFTIREHKCSVRYLTAPTPAGAAAD